jgi:hypothetical protein
LKAGWAPANLAVDPSVDDLLFSTGAIVAAFSPQECTNCQLLPTGRIYFYVTVIRFSYLQRSPGEAELAAGDDGPAHAHDSFDEGDISSDL